MSDTNEPPHPDGPADEPAPPPPFSEAPPPPPPPSTPPPPAGENPYGATPPDGGGYGAPPPADGGDYGAPPPADGGGYGAPPPADGGGYGAPPPENPYAGQPGQPGGYQATEAIGYGWRKFTQSPGTMLIPTLVAWVGIIVVGILVYAILLGAVSTSSTFTRLLVSGLAEGIFFVFAQVLAAGLYRGALRVADGQDFKIGDMFEGYDKAQVVIAALLIAIGTAIGTVLCYIPGLIVGFLTFFTIMFVVDQHLSAWDAIKASYKLVTENLGSTLVFYILAGLILLVSACICGVGLLVGIPVVLLALGYTYRRLLGQPVVP